MSTGGGDRPGWCETLEGIEVLFSNQPPPLFLCCPKGLWGRYGSTDTAVARRRRHWSLVLSSATCPLCLTRLWGRSVSAHVVWLKRDAEDIEVLFSIQPPVLCFPEGIQARSNLMWISTFYILQLFSSLMIGVIVDFCLFFFQPSFLKYPVVSFNIETFASNRAVMGGLGFLHFSFIGFLFYLRLDLLTWMRYKICFSCLNSTTGLLSFWCPVDRWVF